MKQLRLKKCPFYLYFQEDVFGFRSYKEMVVFNHSQLVTATSSTGFLHTKVDQIKMSTQHKYWGPVFHFLQVLGSTSSPGSQGNPSTLRVCSPCECYSAVNLGTSTNPIKPGSDMNFKARGCFTQTTSNIVTRPQIMKLEISDLKVHIRHMFRCRDMKIIINNV